MARITTSLGGGPTDASTTFGTISTATDYVSAWTPASGSGIAHGGFDATGVTMNTTVKPIRVVAMYGNSGGTANGGSTASFRWQLGTSTGGNGTQETVTHTTNSTASVKYANNYNTTAEYDTSALDWSFVPATHATQMVAGSTYYYGIKGMSSGNFVFARGGTGTIYVNGTASSAWAGNSISAAVVWDTVPTAPTITSASINTSGQVSLGWTVGTDDGMTSTAAWDDTSGAHVTGYNIVYKATTESAWKVFKGQLVSWTNTGGTGRTVTGLTPDSGTFLAGKTYEFRIAGLNKVTDNTTTYFAAYSSIQAQTGTRSASFNALAPGGVYNGSTWAPIVAKVYNGSAWVTPTSLQVYNGSTWKTLI
jgi:hypothetical protein